MSTEIIYVKAEVKIGSPEKPIGMTIYDQITAEPYCVGIKNGEWVKEKDECGANSQQMTDNSQQTTTTNYELQTINSNLDTEPPGFDLTRKQSGSN